MARPKLTRVSIHYYRCPQCPVSFGEPYHLVLHLRHHKLKFARLMPTQSSASTSCHKGDTLEEENSQVSHQQGTLSRGKNFQLILQLVDQENLNK